MHRVNAERIGQPLLGRLRHLHLLVEDLAQPVAEVDLLFGLDHTHQPLHDLDRAVPLLGLLVDASQAAERVGVVGIEAEDVVVRLGGTIGIAQLLLEQLAQGELHRGALAGLVLD